MLVFVCLFVFVTEIRVKSIRDVIEGGDGEGLGSADHSASENLGQLLGGGDI